MCFLEGKTQEETARFVGVSRSTIAKWLKDEAFTKRLREERRKLFTEGLEELKSLLLKAVRTLRDLLENSEKESSKLAVCKTILELGLKAKEMELEERLERLEEVIRARTEEESLHKITQR